MSGRFSHRVKQMERRISSPGRCPKCGGGKTVSFIMEHEQMPEPCFGCSREGIVVVLGDAKPPDGWVQRTMPDDLP